MKMKYVFDCYSTTAVAVLKSQHVGISSTVFLKVTVLYIGLAEGGDQISFKPVY